MQMRCVNANRMEAESVEDRFKAGWGGGGVGGWGGAFSPTPLCVDADQPSAF